MGKAQDYKNLWVEKYRPEKLDDLVLDSNLREDIEKYRKQGEIPHLLFYGQAGGGKTTLAKILVNEVLDCQYHYINASDKSGVDVIRGEIADVVGKRSIDGKLKIIILDECDGLSSHSGTGSSAQSALRNMMEEFAHNARFILTANYINKITNPILSRCVTYQINPPLKEFIIRCANILKQENIKVNKDEFIPYIRGFYPDMRKAINSMQRDSKEGELRISNNSSQELNIDKDIIDHIRMKKSHVELRRMMIQRSSEFSNDYRILLSSLFNYTYECDDLDDDKKRKYMIELSSGLHKNEIVMDKEINAYSTLLKLY